MDNEDQIHSSLSWCGQVFFHTWSLHPHPWNFQALLFCTGSLPQPLLWLSLMQVFPHCTCKTPLCKGIFISSKCSGQGFCILTLCTVSACERREEGTGLCSPKPLSPLLSHLRSISRLLVHRPRAAGISKQGILCCFPAEESPQT